MTLVNPTNKEIYPEKTKLVSPKFSDYGDPYYDNVNDALAAANSDGATLVVVYPGSYAGGITLYDGINIYAYPGVALSSLSASGGIDCVVGGNAEITGATISNNGGNVQIECDSFTGHGTNVLSHSNGDTVITCYKEFYNDPSLSGGRLKVFSPKYTCTPVNLTGGRHNFLGMGAHNPFNGIDSELSLIGSGGALTLINLDFSCSDRGVGSTDNPWYISGATVILRNCNFINYNDLQGTNELDMINITSGKLEVRGSRLEMNPQSGRPDNIIYADYSGATAQIILAHSVLIGASINSIRGTGGVNPTEVWNYGSQADHNVDNCQINVDSTDFYDPDVI